MCGCRSWKLRDERRDRRARPWHVVRGLGVLEARPMPGGSGLDWVGVDLPTCGATDTSIGPLDDVAHVRDLIHSIDGPVVVAGKSYGGTVISGATAGCSNVEHLVYIAAMMPEPDELFHTTTAAARTPGFARGSRLLDDGRVALDPEIGAACGSGRQRKKIATSGVETDGPCPSSRSLRASRAGWLDGQTEHIHRLQRGQSDPTFGPASVGEASDPCHRAAVGSLTRCVASG